MSAMTVADGRTKGAAAETPGARDALGRRFTRKGRSSPAIAPETATNEAAAIQHRHGFMGISLCDVREEYHGCLLNIDEADAAAEAIEKNIRRSTN
jgi:hypothetical protein